MQSLFNVVHIWVGVAKFHRHCSANSSMSVNDVRQHTLDLLHAGSQNSPPKGKAKGNARIRRGNLILSNHFKFFCMEFTL